MRFRAASDAHCNRSLEARNAPPEFDTAVPSNPALRASRDLIAQFARAKTAGRACPAHFGARLQRSVQSLTVFFINSYRNHGRRRAACFIEQQDPSTAVAKL